MAKVSKLEKKPYTYIVDYTYICMYIHLIEKCTHRFTLTCAYAYTYICTHIDLGWPNSLDGFVKKIDSQTVFIIVVRLV